MTTAQFAKRLAETLCPGPNCKNPPQSAGLCHGHYRQRRRHPERELRELKTLYHSATGICELADCGEPHQAKGLCQTHYNHTRRKPPKPSRTCSLEGCSDKHFAKDLCSIHYGRAKYTRVRTPVVESDWRTWRRHRSPEGYMVRSYRLNGRSTSKLEHRLVFEDSLGRELRPEENVHHINGVKDDNDPDNLELWSTSQPSGQRITDKADWAEEILRLYRPHRLKETD